MRDDDQLIRLANVDRTPDNDIRLTVYPEGGDLREGALYLVLPLDVAVGLLGQLVSQTMYGVIDVAADTKAGDCPTCQNTRLVDGAAPGGRTWRVHCPDCRPAFEKAQAHPFARPRIGGGIS
jgi:hypothetical protein